MRRLGLAGSPDFAADVFALAASLYFLLTRRLPFVGKTEAELVRKTWAGLPRPDPCLAGVPRAVDELLRAGLQAEAAPRVAAYPHRRAARSDDGSLAAAAPAGGALQIVGGLGGAIDRVLTVAARSTWRTIRLAEQDTAGDLANYGRLSHSLRDETHGARREQRGDNLQKEDAQSGAAEGSHTRPRWRGARRRHFDWSTLEEQEPIEQCEEQPESKGESEIETTGHQIDLEAAIGIRLNDVGDRGQFLRRDLRGHARCQHQQHELAAQRRIDPFHRGQQHDVQDGLKAR